MSNGHIFISYRRDDSAGYARAIYDHFVQHFSKERVFMDVDAIEPGHPFDEAIERAVGQCEVLLAMIGRRWLDQQASTSPRINDPKDYVRLEIAAALSRNIRVVPVLLDGANMPTEEELPEPLRALAQRNAIEVSNSRFKSDVERLIAAVSKALGEPVARAPMRNPHGRTSTLYWTIGALAAGALSLIIYFQFPSYDRNRPAESVSGEKDESSPPKVVDSQQTVEKPNSDRSLSPKVGTANTDQRAPSSGNKENEPNNQAPDANPIALGTRVQGAIAPNDDWDFFRFRTSSRTPSNTTVILRKLSSAGFWADVSVYDRNERRIRKEWRREDESISLVFESTPNSIYFLSVKSQGKGGPYELEVREE